MAQFLRACLGLVGIRNELPFWAVVKVGLLSLLLQLRYEDLCWKLGDGPATIGHPACRRVTMAIQNLAWIMLVYGLSIATTLGRHICKLSSSVECETGIYQRQTVREPRWRDGV